MDEIAAAYYHHPPPPLLPPLSLSSQQQQAHYLHVAPPQLIPLQQPSHHHRILSPLYPPPPPPTHSLSSLSYSQSNDDDVRTLFVAGLPDDVVPREIYNLFREFPGFVSSNLRNQSQPFAFAVFADQESAVAAMHSLNGMVFDLEKGSTLYIDLAKSNSRSKRPRTDDEGRRSDKKLKGSSATRGGYDTGLGSFHDPGMSNSAYNTIGYPPARSHLGYDGRGFGETDAAKSINSTASRAPQNNPPCPTIFVADLGPNCSEHELTQVFSRCRGFVKLKIQNTYGAPVAFVDFQDTASSTEALQLLQGSVLHSTPTGEGMRLEYAKSRMGMRRKRK